MTVSYMQCCGLRELEGLRYHTDPKVMLLEFIRQTFRPPTRMRFGSVVYTEAATGVYATKLTRYIRKNKLGRVATIRPFLNPNSNNIVRMFVWTMDRAALQAWYEANVPADKRFT